MVKNKAQKICCHENDAIGSAEEYLLCRSLSQQWLLSLYLVGTACTQWKK